MTTYVQKNVIDHTPGSIINHQNRKALAINLLGIQIQELMIHNLILPPVLNISLISNLCVLLPILPSLIPLNSNQLREGSIS